MASEHLNALEDAIKSSSNGDGAKFIFIHTSDVVAGKKISQLLAACESGIEQLRLDVLVDKLRELGLKWFDYVGPDENEEKRRFVCHLKQGDKAFEFHYYLDGAEELKQLKAQQEKFSKPQDES